MPFISIIIPTYNNEEHIEQAIDSCFDSDFDDFEIIVINDASTDGTAAKLELLADRYYGKIKAITSPHNNGLGETRNIGLEHAKGDYIMFLDGDDWFELNSIKTVAKKLQEIKPDVLMFNHQRVWESGFKSPNIPNKYVNLSDKEKDISATDDRVGAIRNLHSACNKAYKASFIIEHCGAFQKGFYEDFSWSIKAVINANKIYYIPETVLNYRQRYSSITKTCSIKHYDIFKQIKITQEFLDKTNNREIEKHIYEYSRSLLFGIIRTGYRIPKPHTRLFIKESYKTLTAWRKKLNIRHPDLYLLLAKPGYELILKPFSRPIKTR